MRSGKTWMALALLGALSSGAAQAALHDRGGGLLYDDVLDVTWLADANYAKTSGYDADGHMSWNHATSWATNLDYYDSVRGVTWSDWRLPVVRDEGLVDFNFGYSGPDWGYNVRTVDDDGTVYSELAQMFFNNLGFKSEENLSGGYQSDFGIFADGTIGDQRDGVGPNSVIVNLRSDAYWSGTVYSPNQGLSAWNFYTSIGSQRYNVLSSEFYAWALRPGDVAAVPEPVPAALFGVGLAGLMLARRRSGAARG